MFDGLTSGITKIYEFIVSLPSKIADALKWLFDLIVDAIKAVAGAVWNFFKDPVGNILDFLGSIFDVIKSLGQFIIDGIMTVLKFLFIPDDKFFENKLNHLNDLLNQKIKTESYVELLENLQYAGRMRASLPPLTINIFGQNVTIVDFSLYAKYQETIYGWVRGFVFVFLVLYNFNNVYKLIRNGSMAGGMGTQAQNDYREGKDG